MQCKIIGRKISIDRSGQVEYDEPMSKQIFQLLHLPPTSCRDVSRGTLRSEGAMNLELFGCPLPRTGCLQTPVYLSNFLYSPQIWQERPTDLIEQYPSHGKTLVIIKKHEKFMQRFGKMLPTYVGKNW